MAPSPPPADAIATEPAVAPFRAAPLEALDFVERRWRDALSYVLAGDVEGTAREVEAAGGALATLGSLEEARARLADDELAAFAAAAARLTRLHAELVAASRKARSAVGDELAAARRGRAALQAYAPGDDEPRRYDVTG
jgi:hypothetical protein